MSEEAKVEAEGTAEAEDKEADAIWAEIQAGRGAQGSAPPPEKADEPDKGEATPKEEAPAKEPPASQADDPLSNAPPELLPEIEKLRTRAEEAERLAARHSGRLTKLNTELNEVRAELGKRDEKAATPKGEEATDREERRRQLREEYPDSAGKVLDDVIDLEERQRALETRIEELSGAHKAQASEQTEELLQEQLSFVQREHPDWQDVISVEIGGKRNTRPEFEQWVLKQPTYIIEAVRANAEHIIDGATVADILTRFKNETADPAKERHDERRKDQLDALRDPALRTPQAKPSDDDEDRIWQELQEKRRRAASSG